RDSGNLVRVAADRYGLRLNREITSALDGELEVSRAARQAPLAEHATGSDAYTMLHAGLSFRAFSATGVEHPIYARAGNLLNDQARQHSSFIKDDVLLPGRNLTLGVRYSL